MEKKTQKNIWLTIMGALTVAIIIITCIAITQPYLAYVCGIIVLLCSALYSFFFYNKPHGNLLKISFLIFAISKLISDACIISADTQFSILGAFSIVSAAIVCYCAGRLSRIEQNKYILIIIDVFYFALSTIECINLTTHTLLNILCMFNYPITLTVLMIAYFVRYKEHKEAGLMDAPKK